MEDNKNETLQKTEQGQAESAPAAEESEQNQAAVAEQLEQETEMPAKTVFTEEEVFEETSEEDASLAQDLAEGSQQATKREMLYKSIIGILAVATVLLAAILMMKSGTAKKADFLDQHIALISSGTSYYHVYDCEQLDRSSFIAYNIKTAENKGYLPCPECHSK